MATTSLWHIKGRLKDLVDYVENPEKTVAKTPELQDLYNVFSYVQRPEATQEGEYVTALNCLKETALRQMILTKKRYGKTDGYIAWHGYQSFKPEEVTPQLAHEIGVKLAKELVLGHCGGHPRQTGILRRYGELPQHHQVLQEQEENRASAGGMANLQGYPSCHR